MKIKKYFQNKSFLALFSSLAFILIMSVVIVVLIFNNNEVTKEEKENNEVSEVIKEENHLLYLKANVLVKLEFKESTYEEDVKRTITDYELLNTKAKELYAYEEFKNQNISDVLEKIVAVLEKEDIKEIEFTTDSSSLTKEEITNYLKESNLNIIFNYHSVIDEEQITKNNSYIITFDTDGGSLIEKQEVIEDGLVKEPDIPIKIGYTFVEWQLNDTKYDFNTKVNSDLTLKAKWEKAPELDTKNFEVFNIKIENISSGLEASIKNLSSLKVSVTGTTEGLKTMNAKTANVYIDVKDLKEGTYEVEVKTKNIDDGFKYVFEPAKVKVEIKKPDEHAGIFNLNENIAYYETSMSCWNYRYVNPVCLDKTVKELKETYPDYDKELDSLEIKDTEKVSLSRYNDVSFLKYFPTCVNLEIPSSILNTLQNLKGSTLRSEGTKVYFSYINFKEEKYSNLIPDIDYSRYGLLQEGGCGDSGDYEVETFVLDENMCNKYHLTCDRW